MSMRPYQVEAVQAVYDAWSEGQTAVGISLPTGTGKTHIMVAIAAEEVAAGKRVMILLHRDQLVEQTYARLKASLNPRISIGIVKGSRNEVGAKILVSSVHSLRSATRRGTLPPIDCCIVDEAHVSVSPTYKAVFEHIRPRARLVGFSATWVRSDDTGLGDVWDDIVYRRDIKWAVKNGFLVRPTALQVGGGIDVSGATVSRATGDYVDAQLETLVMLDDVRDTVVKAAAQHRGKAGVLFAPTIASAEYFREGLLAAGITAEGIYASTSAGQRRLNFAGHIRGDVEILTTCTALAEGWDAPHCSIGYLCRPTKHEGLFTQLVGRLLRPWPGKSRALLLDFVGATDNVKLVNAVDLSVTRENSAGEIEDYIPVEIEEREKPNRMVKRIRSTHEVDLLDGTVAHWLQGPNGVPFVPCGNTVIFIVEGADGWMVGQTMPGATAYAPAADRLATGLSQSDALSVASDHAEEHGGVASRKAAWRNGAPSDKQLSMAGSLGLPIEGASRGSLSDDISVRLAQPLLNVYAQWSRNQLELTA